MKALRKYILMNKAGDDVSAVSAGGGGAGGGGGAAGAGAAGGTGATGNGDAGAGADDKGGAGSGAADWRSAIAGEDAALLESLKGIDDPKILLDAHTSQTQWRETLAGDNKDALKTLERFASPKALWDSYEALRTRVAKGELKNVSAFPDKGTDEQKASWRAENGIPEDSGKYDIKLPEGVDLDQVDKESINGFTKFAFEHNLPADTANNIVNWYLTNQVERTEAANAQFDERKTETTAELSQEWGPEYKANINKIQGVLDATIPGDQKELKSLIFRAVQTNPHFARHYAAIALQLNPAGTLVPGDRGANEGSVSDEIKKIETTMRTDRAAYNKDDGMQKRYRELLTGYEKLTGRPWSQ